MPDSSHDGRCAACGSAELRPHLHVAGSAGEQGLIPTTDAYGTALADIVACERCGHVQLERFPEEAELAEVADRIWAPDFRDRMAIVARAPSGRRPG